MNTPLPEKVQKLFLIFKQAVEDERNAQVMYKKAVELCEDEMCREVFEGFYSDEVRHEKILMQRYNMLREKYGVDKE